jgi:hypothetical protein
MEYKRCIFIMADGARADVFEDLLISGRLPNIAKYVVEPGTHTKAVSVFPSTTGPAYAPFILGKFPGRCNLPGIRWFDRKSYSSKLLSLHRFRSYVGIGTFLMNGDISTDTPTLFEVFPSTVSILNELNRGVGFKGDKTKLLKVYYKMKSHFTSRTDEVDLAATRILLDSLGENSQFTYVVFLSIDTYSHSNHPFHKKVISSYLRIDETVGSLGRMLEKEGRLEETILVIASDHGLSLTHSHFDSVEFMNGLGYKTLHYPNVFRFYRNADAANMVSGNAMTHIYVRSPMGWEQRSTFEELAGLVDNLIERPEVDLIAGIDNEGRARIKSERGEAVSWLDEEGLLRYHRISDDPFGYRSLPKRMSTDEALKSTFNTEYPDGILQIIQLLESPRSGDLLVSAKPGYDLRAKHEKPEHRSSHGSLSSEHMHVPLAVNFKIGREYPRTVDLYPTILRLMGHRIPERVDGTSLVD